MFENGIRSGKEAVACFSSFIAKAMSDRSKKYSSGRTTPSSKTKMEVDKRREARQKEAAERLTKEKVRTEEAKKEREKKEWQTAEREQRHKKNEEE